MEMAISLNQLVKLPVSSSKSNDSSIIIRHSFVSTRTNHHQQQQQQKVDSSSRRHQLLVVEAKGKRGGGMAARQYQRQPPPALPKLEDDGNPKFVIFIRTADVYLWYPLNLVTGGTTAKIMVAAKDTFLGKYIYKDTLSRNLAAVIYRDEKQMQTLARKQFRILKEAKEFRYGYKLVENTNLKSALSTSDVIELPRKEEIKTVLDKVKDFFGDAKESFGKLTSLTPDAESTEEDSKKQPKEKSTV